MAYEFEPYINHRPWGSENRFSYNVKSTVKVLNVKKGGQFSIQYHNKRHEYWHILSGKGKVLLGKKWHNAKKGDDFFIPPKTLHSARGGGGLRILEISFGKFDQKDLVRVKDIYNRSDKDNS